MNNKVNGFYYDVQKKNLLTSITLHCNTDLEGNVLSNRTDGDGDYPYSLDPIFSAILNEDFSVGIANDWSSFDGGDPIGDVFNSMKPYAAYANYAAKNIGDIQQSITNWDGGSGETPITEAIMNFTNKTLNFIGGQNGVLSKSANYLSKSLVMQGTRFSYYGGTGVSFGNLGMKFIVFADWEGNSFKTVSDQLEKLYPYIMGQYKDLIESNPENALNDFIGWQEAPGGFMPDVKYLDTVQKGTLKLKFGGYYSLSNLLVRDAQLNFSKQMVKNPITKEISPLYCEVILSFQPATKYTDVKLREFVSANKSMESTRQSVETTLSNALKEESEKLSKLIENS